MLEQHSLRDLPRAFPGPADPGLGGSSSAHGILEREKLDRETRQQLLCRAACNPLGLTTSTGAPVPPALLLGMD